MKKYTEVTDEGTGDAGPILEKDIFAVEKYLGFSFHDDLRGLYLEFGNIEIDNVGQYGPRLVNPYNGEISRTADRSGIVVQTSIFRENCKDALDSDFCIWREDISWFVIFNNDTGKVKFYDGIAKKYSPRSDKKPGGIDLEDYLIEKIQGGIDAELEWQEKHGK